MLPVAQQALCTKGVPTVGVDWVSEWRETDGTALSISTGSHSFHHSHLPTCRLYSACLLRVHFTSPAVKKAGLEAVQ